MQASQIKKGEFYAETRDKDIFGWGTPARVEVLETHVEKRARSWGNPTIGCTVRVHPRGEGEPYERWVPNRQIKMPWDEYAAERAKRDAATRRYNEERDAKRLDRVRRARELERRIADAGVEDEQRVYVGHNLTGVVARGGYEVDEKGYVNTVFANLPKHVERGDALLVRAESLVGHDPI